MDRKHALLAVFLALASGRAAAELPSVAGVPMDVEAEAELDSPSDIDGAAWFRREFRNSRKPKLSELLGGWGAVARTIGGGWQVWAGEGLKLAPLGMRLAFVAHDDGTTTVTSADPQEPALVSDEPTARSRRLARSAKFSLTTRRAWDEGQGAKTSEDYACRLMGSGHLICRLWVSRGDDEYVRVFRVYARLK